MTEETPAQAPSSAPVRSNEALVGISENAYEHAVALHELESEALRGAVVERPTQKAWADAYDAVTRMLVVSTALPVERTPQ